MPKKASARSSKSEHPSSKARDPASGHRGTSPNFGQSTLFKVNSKRGLKPPRGLCPAVSYAVRDDSRPLSGSHRSQHPEPPRKIERDVDGVEARTHPGAPGT